MQPTLSIVFATFNSGSYLDSFFKSLFLQNLKNFEIVVVDDGSNDNSHKISLEWAKNFSNIKSFQQKNLGLSVARNRGIELANGKWIVLPDPDDILYPNLYSHLIKIANKNKLDVGIINGFHIFDNKKPKLILDKKIQPNIISTGQDFFKDALSSSSFLHTTWLNIYSSKFIKNNNLKFVPNLLHQDILWTTEVLLLAKKVMYSNHALYGYVHRSGSATRQKNSDSKNIKSIKNYSKILLLLDAFNKLNIHKIKYVSTFKSQIPNEFSNIKRSLNRIKNKDKLILAVDYLNQYKIFELVLKNSRFSISLFKNLIFIFKLKLFIKFNL